MVPVMWSLWKNQNCCVWQNRINSEVGVVGAARRMVDEWRVARMVNVRESLNARVGAVKKWQNLEKGWIKANTDVALFDGGSRSGLACVVRNENGNVPKIYW